MKTSILTAMALTLTVACPAQTFNLIHSFTGRGQPDRGLVLSGNTLYGASSWDGIIFKLNTDGSGFTPVSTNQRPNGVIVSGSTLYGTQGGGTDGSVFKMQTDGSGYTILKTFAYSEGTYPDGPVILKEGVLYGTTSAYGSGGGGTVFRINIDGGGFAVLHNFAEAGTDNTDGSSPMGRLVLDEAGTLYGIAYSAGSGGGGTNYGRGTIYKVDTNGNDFAVLHSFSPLAGYTNADGGNPRAGLVLSGGMLYGTAMSGGSEGYGTVFKLKTNGSGFTVLHHFSGSPVANSSAGPWAGLVLKGNTLYGVTPTDGNCYHISGTVFKVNTDGTGFAILQHFSDVENFNPALGASTNDVGGAPLGDLVLEGNSLYGTCFRLGPGGSGTVFSLELPCPDCPPTISSVTQSNGAFAFSWNANLGSSYQVQYKTDPASTDWYNLGDVVLATNTTTAVSDAIGPDQQRFYRVALLVP